MVLFCSMPGHGTAAAYQSKWTDYDKMSQDDSQDSDVSKSTRMFKAGGQQAEEADKAGWSQAEEEDKAGEQQADEKKQGARRRKGVKFRDNAFQIFAQAKCVTLEDVTLQQIEADPLGFEGWAFKDVDTSSQGALRQSIRISLDKPENHKQKQIYKYLSAVMQCKFALAWGTDRNFEFLNETKQTELYSETKAGKKRRWMTPQAIAGILGDATDPDNLRSAYKWCDECWTYEDPDETVWWKWSSWLGRYLFLYEEEVEEEMEGEKHSSPTQLQNKVNLFEQAALERKSILNYALKFKLKPNLVSIDLVKASKLGIQGWAEAGEPDNKAGGRPPKMITEKESTSGGKGTHRRSGQKRKISSKNLLRSLRRSLRRSLERLRTSRRKRCRGKKRVQRQKEMQRRRRKQGKTSAL